ncbi:hypothetical protein NCCP1664_24120 [Zafaria cholistanensis]|uniref:Amylopullulanase X25 domain-containing protein n=1 Tax=Zafaria cholistanensis TaxID=1682741 RepID=A0A5A7NV45_9MICC|nr:glycosidase [Zafaria cholistanensis]GER23917.1 hypothetical protein NCCP1664_24120 [Zafaria cholistanensis]
MAKDSKLEARLKAVLDGLAAADQDGGNANAGTVLSMAVAAHPFDEQEAHLLSGGVPRGYKALTTATAKLVKAGWMVKGRGGWAITEEGLRALVAFPTAEELGAALAAGTPVPADIELPAPVEAEPQAAGPAAEPETAGPEAAGEPAAEPEAAGEPAAEQETAEPEASEPEASEDRSGQPESVAIAGDFAALLGGAADWAPELDEVQMEFHAPTLSWVRTVDLPAGTYSFKIAVNRSWAENYGAFGSFDGANHELNHGGGTITIHYRHDTKDITIS